MKLLNGGWLGITASRDYPISPVDVISQHRSAEHQYAPAAGKSFAIGSNEGAGSLRCLPRVGAVGDGWMGLSFEFHLPEIRPLVPFVRQRGRLGQIQIDHSGAANLHNNLHNDFSI